MTPRSAGGPRWTVVWVNADQLRERGQRPGRPERPLDGGRAIVVVPVYKPVPEPDEAYSWSRCRTVFADQPVALVAPEGLDVSAYLAGADPSARPVDVIRFDPGFFLSTAHYSRLLLSPGFYEPLLSFDFVLVHQLDALAFRDELVDWSDRDYDYVGAPWIDEAWVAADRHRWSAGSTLGDEPAGSQPPMAVTFEITSPPDHRWQS